MFIVDALTLQTTLFVMTKTHVPQILALLEKDVSTHQSIVTIIMLAPRMFVLMVFANISLAVMTKMLALSKNASMDNALALQRVVTIAMHAQPTLVMQQPDAKTHQLPAMTTMLAPRTLAILNLDVFILLSIVMTKTLALLILALTEIAFMLKRVATITTNAQLKLVMFLQETVFTLQSNLQSQIAAPSELVTQLKESLTLQEVARMEINAQ
jgi:hypothetical protein